MFCENFSWFLLKSFLLPSGLEMLYLRWKLSQCNQPHWPLAFNNPLILSPCQLHQEFPSSHPSKCLPCSMLLNLSVPMETEVSNMAPLLAYRLKSIIFNVKYSVPSRALWAKPTLANLLGLVAVYHITNQSVCKRGSFVCCRQTHKKELAGEKMILCLAAWSDKRLTKAHYWNNLKSTVCRSLTPTPTPRHPH